MNVHDGPGQASSGPEPQRAAQAQAGKYLTFRLAAEEYGLEILKVQEIIGMMNVTRVPKMARCVRGVINLRGKLIPVIDMRMKFELAAQADTPKTCIIVVQVQLKTHRVTMGIIVDNVSEVLNIEASQLDPPPAFGASVHTEFMLGMGKVGEKVVILLDLDRVLGDMEGVEGEEAIDAIGKTEKLDSPVIEPALELNQKTA